jgi:hypothetical protein
LIIVGALCVGILALATYFELRKSAGVKHTPFTSMPAPDGNSPRKTAKRMVMAVCMNCFSMHILTNKASPFNDRATLKRYKADIRNPLVIAYIKGVKGWDDNE